MSQVLPTGCSAPFGSTLAFPAIVAREPNRAAGVTRYPRGEQTAMTVTAPAVVALFRANPIQAVAAAC